MKLSGVADSMDVRICRILYKWFDLLSFCVGGILSHKFNTSDSGTQRETDAMCLWGFPHLHKVVSYYFGCHEDEHDGKTEGDISRSLHHDNSQTESHPHNATCGEQHIITRTILLS